MKISVYSLKTGLFLTLALILALSMILLDIVMIRMTEKELFRARIQKGKVIMSFIEQTLITGLQGQDSGYHREHYPFHRHISELVKKGSLSAVLILDHSGDVLFETAAINEAQRNTLLRFSERSLRQGRDIISTPPAAWGILSSKGGDLFLAAPLSHNKAIVGAASVQIPLASMYAAIRESQKIVFFYMLLNTLFLGLLGFYLLHRSLVRPIDRLVKRAEEFKEGESFFLAPKSGQNEFGRLSRALNFTLRGLEESKAELKTSISSLEKANVELRQAQEEIIRSEKLASIGRLASGIAHEIGNPIGIVLGYLDLLKGSELDKEERSDIINRIGGEIDRVNRIIGNLLDFSRPSKGEVEEVSIHQTIIDMLDMLKHQPMMADVSLTLDQGADQDTVLADPDKLKQVFLNIIMNAIDAMEVAQAGGEIPQKTLSIQTRSAPAAQSGKRDGHNVHIHFTDSGPGISDEDIHRIFDPFYTTKEPGKGTGLGLSVSLRIVEDMGGDIKARSELGKGTTMTVILPLHSSTKAHGLLDDQ
jgi:two-component system NtrC family sensor kinase